MKNTYSVKELQRETAAAVRTAESGVLVTITRHERPVAHVISDERLSALLETLDPAANPNT
ncbi:MAG: hypothetical protein Udaeo2_08960 [Candidatus Udaeobacter sp.]|nr:MAG: hypothetical protein Udaeo2_08960 [Candidatus Udaeobacter sp.]